MRIIAAALALTGLLFSCATTGDSPESNKREVLFTGSWEESKALVLEAFQAEGLSVVKNDIHDGWVYLLDGEGADGYRVQVMIFDGETEVTGEVTGILPEGVMLWGDTPQTSFLRTLQEMSPGITLRMMPAAGQEGP